MFDLPPYARLLGLSTHREGDETIWLMPFADAVVGRPGYLHGGAIAGLLEFAALGTLAEALDAGTALKPINVPPRPARRQCRSPRLATRPRQTDRRGADERAAETLNKARPVPATVTPDVIRGPPS